MAQTAIIFDLVTPLDRSASTWSVPQMCNLAGILGWCVDSAHTGGPKELNDALERVSACGQCVLLLANERAYVRCEYWRPDLLRIVKNSGAVVRVADFEFDKLSHADRFAAFVSDLFSR